MPGTRQRVCMCKCACANVVSNMSKAAATSVPDTNSMTVKRQDAGAKPDDKHAPPKRVGVSSLRKSAKQGGKNVEKKSNYKSNPEDSDEDDMHDLMGFGFKESSETENFSGGSGSFGTGGFGAGDFGSSRNFRTGGFGAGDFSGGFSSKDYPFHRERFDPIRKPQINPFLTSKGHLTTRMSTNNNNRDDEDEEGYKTVRYKRRKPVYGTKTVDASNKRMAGERTEREFSVFIGGVSNAFLEADMLKYIEEELKIKVIKVVTNKINERNRSYKVTVLRKDKNELFNPSNWEESIIIKAFRLPRQNGDEER